MASSGNRIPLEVRKVILRYLSERLVCPVISTSEAAREIRRKLPEDVIAAADRRLVNYIAETADEAGFGVSFDGEERLQ